MKRFSPYFLATLLTLAMAATLCVFCGYAVAAPVATTDPYPAGAGQPASAVVTVDNLSQIVCVMNKDSAGAVTPVCDLAALPAGTHTLVMTVTNTYGCTTGTDGASATCTGGGSASSAPFTFVWNTSAVSKPRLLVKP